MDQKDGGINSLEQWCKLDLSYFSVNVSPTDSSLVPSLQLISAVLPFWLSFLEDAQEGQVQQLQQLSQWEQQDDFSLSSLLDTWLLVRSNKLLE